MRKLLLFALALSIGFISCDKEESVKNLELEKSSIQLVAGAEATVEITDGNGGYKVTSRQQAIATAEVNGSTITIKALKMGKATIDVKDRENKKANLKVTVTPKALALDKSELSLIAGETVEVKITAGSGKYSVKSANEKVATAAIDEEKIIITGVTVGETSIEVTDKHSKDKQSLKVTITENPNALTLDTNEITMEDKASATVNITNGSGEGNYSAVVTPKSVADVVINGTVITITAKETAANATIIIIRRARTATQDRAGTRWRIPGSP